MPSVISPRLALLAFLALSASVLAAGSLPPQTSSQSGVTVKVTPRGLATKEWEFEMAFDTHSGDLKDDPLKSAVLVVDGGAPSAPTGWKGDAAGGHHRSGVLHFAATTASPANFELRLRRPAESEPRVFRWRLR